VSAWYPGPAYGVVFRNKTGDRAAKVHPDLATGEREAPGPSTGDDPELRGVVSTAPDGDADDLADRYVTDERIDAARREAEAAGESGFEVVRSRLLASVFREHADVLLHGEDGEDGETPDLDAFRAAVDERVGRRLG